MPHPNLPVRLALFDALFAALHAQVPVDLNRTHALLTPSEAEEQGVVLRRPSELIDEPTAR